jgi:hypothetical protein
VQLEQLVASGAFATDAIWREHHPMRSAEAPLRTLLVFGSFAATVFAVGCGSRGVSSVADAGAPDLWSAGAHPSGTVSVPMNNRADPMPCAARPASMACSGGSACKTDADCIAAQNGRCNGGGTVTCVCTYDQCDSDSDCSAGQDCACRITLRGTPDGAGPNRCVSANCRSDADCGASGFCSASRTSGACESYVDGYYCHTPADECGVDADCIPDRIGYPVCAYRQDLGHWACLLGEFCNG